MWVAEKHQVPILASPARYKVIVHHRKARKTTLAINELNRWAEAVPDVYWYVGPERAQAKETVWDDPNMLPRYVRPAVWAKRDNSDLKIKYPNGSILYVKGARDPDRMRGPNPRGVILDEYDDMDPMVWSGVVQPIMTASMRNSWTWFVGTYKGKKDLYAKYQYATTSGNPNWAGFLLAASKSGIIPPEALADMKATSTAAWFDQEMECVAIDGALSCFRRVRENLYPLEEALYDPRHQVQLGIDLGKYQDWTVITPFDLNDFRLCKQERFNQIDWPMQKARIESAYYRYGMSGYPRTLIDRTGVGDPITDDLMAAGLSRIEPFAFTGSSRENLLQHLSMLIEQDKVRIPDDPGLINEFESFRYELTGTGKVRMSVPEGVHDDRVMSAALAVWGLNERVPCYGSAIRRYGARQNEGFDKHSVI
jgi:hypothetical protein